MNRICAIFIALILFMCLVHWTLAKAATYSFQAKRIKCEDVDPRLSFNYTCLSRNLNRTTKGYSVQIHLQPNVSLDNVFIKVTANLKTNNAFRRKFIDTEEDFCGYQTGTKKSPLISMLWPVLKRSGNLKDKCPYTGLLSVSDVVFDDELLPPFLPEGEVMLVIHIRNGPNRISLMKVSVLIEIKPKGANKLILR